MLDKNNQIYECATSTVIEWKKLDGKSFFVTGATGLVGKYIVSTLLCRNELFNAGTRITVVGRDEEKYISRFSDIKQLFPASFGKVKFVKHDFNDPYLSEINDDYVVHLASNTHPRLYAADPVGTEMANILGTYYLLNAMKNHEGRFFLASSGDVYGDNKSSKMYIDEDDCGYINCNTLRAGYIEGKRASEALCQAFKEKYAIDFVTGRLCRIYGITVQLEDSKAITQFIRSALNRDDIVLKSHGTQTFSYLNIYDVSTAIFTILLNGKNGEAYNVADKTQYCSLRELANIIAEIAGTKVVIEAPDKLETKGASDFNSVILNSEKLEKLGWKPRYSLYDGLNNTIKELRSFEE